MKQGTLWPTAKPKPPKPLPTIPPCPVKCGEMVLDRPFQCVHQWEAWRDERG